MNKRNLYNAFLKFRKILEIERKEISQLYVLALFSGLLSLVLPIGIQSIINLIQTGRPSTSWIMIIVIVVLSIAINGFLQLMQLRITENLQQKIFVWSSMEMTYRFRFLDRQKSGAQYPPELANRFFDTLVIQKGLSKVLIDIPTAAIQILFGVILLSFYHPFFIALGLLLIVFLVFTLTFSSRNAFETSLEESKSKYKTAHWIQEVARASSAFEITGENDFTLQKNDHYATGYLHAREKHFSILWRQSTYLIIFKILIALSLLLVGGLLVMSEEMTIGQFIASEIVILLVISSVEKLILSLSTLYDVLTSTQKISEIAELPLNNEVMLTKLAEFAPHNSTFTFDHVSFTSPLYGKSILTDVDLVITPNSKVAVISNDQLASEVLLKLLQFHYNASSGDILINGVKSSHFDLSAVKKNIGTFFGSDTIFYGSVLDNLLLGRQDISDNQLKNTIERLNIGHFVNALPNGLDTYLLSGGGFLPPEVTDKIILGRALLQTPSLLLLDTRWQLMYEMDKDSLTQELSKQNQSVTMIACVTDRSLLELFDQVLVLEDGKVLTFGNKAEVISKINLDRYCHV